VNAYQAIAFKIKQFNLLGGSTAAGSAAQPLRVALPLVLLVWDLFIFYFIFEKQHKT